MRTSAAVSHANSEAVDDTQAPEPFKVPAGYQVKKRRKRTVYCRKAMQSGTRFSQEKCYSEETLRAMEATKEQDQANFDQAR